MSSFRSRIRLSALLLIGALLVTFSVLLYSGLSIILHRYQDARLLAFGEAWAEFIEDNTGSLPEAASQTVAPGLHGQNRDEYRELREVALAITVNATDGSVVWKGPAARILPALPAAALSKVLRGETVYDTIEIPTAPSIRRISLPVFREGKVKYILQTESSM